MTKMRRIRVIQLSVVIALIVFGMFTVDASSQDGEKLNYSTFYMYAGQKAQIELCFKEVLDPWTLYPNLTFDVKILDYVSGTVAIHEPELKALTYVFMLPKSGHFVVQVLTNKGDGTGLSPVVDSRLGQLASDHCPEVHPWWLYGQTAPTGAGSIE